MAGRIPLSDSGACDRTREWVSLRLDDELSPLEEELLERHLLACVDCRAFDRDVRWATDVLRSTAADRPSRRVTISTVRGRIVPAASRRVAAAAVAALALGALVGSVSQGPPSTRPESPPQVSLLDSGELDFPRLKGSVRAPAPEPPPSPNPLAGVI